MKNLVVGVLWALLIMASFVASSPVNAADKPKLPLQLGVYLPAGVKCPPSETIIQKDALPKLPKNSILFYGDGFGFQEEEYSNNFWYYINQVRNNGNTYYIKGTTITETGGHIMGTFNMTITIQSQTSFLINKAEGLAPAPEMLINKKKPVYTYRYCGNPLDIEYPRR